MSNVDTYEIFGNVRNQFRENNDCTVIGMATAFGISYEQAHKFMRENCKRPANGGVTSHMLHRFEFMADLPADVEKLEFKCKGKEHNITLNQFCKRYPKGRFYVFVREHALAVVDGVIHDHSYKPRRHVLFAYRVIDKSEEGAA